MTTDDVVVDVSQDWVLACDVQRRFMLGLGRTSDSVDYSARCRQVRALGGDCYDFMPLTNDRLALVVGDASGKGVAAALMIASVQSSLRTAALFTGSDLPTLLKIVNLQAYASSLADRYATVFYGVFDGATSAAVAIIPMLMLGFGASGLRAQTQDKNDGNALLESCNETVKFMNDSNASVSMAKSAWCLGYIQGFVSSMEAQKMDKSTTYAAYLKSNVLGISLPPDVTSGQIARVIVKWLQDHPQELHHDIGLLTHIILREAFPAKQQVAKASAQ
jgi:hypothetical protein